MHDSWLVKTVGLLTLLTIGVKCLFSLVAFLRRLFGQRTDLRKYGNWAVVTGASDGIGRSYAKLLARAGLNIVLIGRNRSKLEVVANEIRSTYPSTRLKIIAVDFTDSNDIYKILKKELNNLEIGILVNNVGMAGPSGILFTKIENEQILNDTINCNLLSMVRMSHTVLPQMIRRKKGVVINLGSVAGAAPSPMLTLYGATKAFIEKFSQDLAFEVKPYGITVQTLLPGYFVATNMVRIVKPSWINPDPDTYVESALITIGLESRTAGFWIHRIQLALCDWVRYFVPRSIVESVIYFFIKMFADGYVDAKTQQ